MTKRVIELKGGTYKVLMAIIANLEQVLLGGPNRIRGVGGVLKRYFASQGTVMNSGRIHEAVLELEKLKIIKKIEKRKVNGDKRPAMVWQFNDAVFNAMKIVDIGDVKAKKTTPTKETPPAKRAYKKRASKIAESPLPAPAPYEPQLPDFIGKAEQRLALLESAEQDIKNLLGNLIHFFDHKIFAFQQEAKEIREQIAAVETLRERFGK